MRSLSFSRFNQLSENSRSAIFMVLAMLGFVFNDTLTKLSSADVGVFQAMFIRAAMLSLFIGLLVWRQGLPLNPLAYLDKMLWLRIVAEIGGAILFFTALFNMPLANVTAVLQVTPLLITLILALFLGEQVGWRRYLAIFAGFLGVMFIIRPGSSGFNIYSLAALGAVVGIVIRDLATQRVPSHIPSLFVVYATTVINALTTGLLTFVNGWEPIGWTTYGILAGAACFVYVGYIFSVLTMRVGEASFTATFRYTSLVWAILMGVLVFGDFPDGLTLLGAGIVTVAGIYSLYRERLAKRSRLAKQQE
ncbi:MAG: DMT family transporter [Chloroflexota bacterium]